MCRKFTPDGLNTMDHETKNDVICQMQDRLDKLEHDYENLIGQIRLADQQRFAVTRKNFLRLRDSSPFLMKQKKTVMKAVRNRPLMRRWLPQ